MSRPSSSKRRHRRKGERRRHGWCERSGKYAYASRKRALGALNTVRAAAPERTLPVAVYRCDTCGDWHLTSRPRASG